MAITEEPIISRLDRLDTMLRQLEEIRGSNTSPKSWSASTTSSGALTSEGHPSSVDFSPKIMEKHCRPMDRVMMEIGIKGSLIERVEEVENRVLKLCSQLEEELEEEKKREEERSEKNQHKKKPIKQLVKRIVKGKKHT
ncbi:uncharacterized protein LOC110825604 [Carica papaya]|uniref:uncharacterized protein LOC110825604 n=1 Tax=Carica papaya TaxID=3649 RepID=UPI000B8CD72D|nr:uncharacterized protein LOC110825604 [Carica papaya]